MVIINMSHTTALLNINSQFHQFRM